jgi:hypothetical protein
MKARVGEVKLVENKGKKSNAKDSYYGVILNHNGQYNSLLFTELELKVAFQRAASNQEDVIDRSFTSLLLD